jgi:hypothetical protein
MEDKRIPAPGRCTGAVHERGVSIEVLFQQGDRLHLVLPAKIEIFFSGQGWQEYTLGKTGS